MIVRNQHADRLRNVDGCFQTGLVEM
jgi:hypothetical protein